ncbi:putative iron transport multicopper oxidase fet3 protein [Phaeoacremonium minimum UCRPA7]|uniref:Putative iron transport multicopper oxidase fet3 protein n=1 Tax=Phaeoacremonium minimum (strain UCR-PA7) TaxID=1286976 RepID=R8BAI0_PHAM7|nr:putative iron transport multicopper oxidase fet3 protein [Phaeoacremonium minimum UCRPA7]EON96306.1 putative iron transport multicopper oxidase fet3 protein [Phaeoacremonium minimum UCRPA7]
MNGTTQMDGPAQVSQCPIAPGAKFTYNFTLDQPGTYWYHSHTHGQYPDGLRAPLIIHDPDFPYKDMYDEELVLTFSDWYHDEMPGLIKFFMSKANPTGAEPVPNAALINETQNLTISVEPGKTYLFRTINMGAFAGQYVWFEGHNMTIVEVDGVYTQPAEAEMIYISAAQRCSFLVTTRNDTSANFPIVGSMDTTLFDTLPDDLNWNVTGWLVYDDSKPLPDAAFVDDLDGTVYDDIQLVPYDNTTLYGEADHEIHFQVIMDNLNDGANYAFFNNITYAAPTVPTLYTALTSGDLATNAQIYGTYTHSFVLAKDEIVQLTIDNLDSGRHPFHLHGHNFQALYRSEDDEGTFADSNITEADFPKMPMRRDTFVIRPNGNMVLRFKANNPGVWLFHCHIEWHVTSGLIATMVEAPLELQKTLEIPQGHYDACAAANVPTAGNAAGNTVDLLDPKGEPHPPGRIPGGFTARGIVALVFSCISGILGTAVVAWYGMAGDVSAAPPKEIAGAEKAGVVPASTTTAGNNNGTVSNGEEVAATTSGGGGTRT